MSNEAMFHITPVNMATYEYASIYKQRGFNNTQANCLMHFSLWNGSLLLGDIKGKSPMNC